MDGVDDNVRTHAPFPTCSHSEVRAPPDDGLLREAVFKALRNSHGNVGPVADAMDSRC